MKYDVFLCYKGSSNSIAGSVYWYLKSNCNSLINVFYAPVCVDNGENYFEICKRTAGKVSLMIMIIDDKFFTEFDNEENLVASEVRSALENKECKFLPILYSNVNFNDLGLSEILGAEDQHRITHINPMKYTDEYTFDRKKLLDYVTNHFNINPTKRIDSESDARVRERTHISAENKKGFFSDVNDVEKERIRAQQKLLLKYDTPVYDKLLKGKSGINVLDLGTGNGSALFERLGNRPEVDRIIGVDFESMNIEHANDLYGSDRISFYQQDVEDNLFPDRLRRIMNENNIEGFDFINILALMSHLKNPSKLLKTVRQFCNKDACIFIRNIDDGFNIAYPDPEGRFKKALDILSKCVCNGYRYSGRQLFAFLQKWGYKNIVLERIGINTTEMNQSEKEAFFDVVFKFIRQGIEREVANQPDSNEISNLHNWLEENYDLLEDEFMSPDFFLFFGFMIYTAEL